MQAQRSGPPQLCEAFNTNNSLRNQAVDCQSRHCPQTCEDITAVVSTSGHCHLRDSMDTILAHFLHISIQSRAMMPKLFGQLRAFPFCGDEKTCRTQTHKHRLLNTWWQAIRPQPANCKECSRSIYPLF